MPVLFKSITYVDCVSGQVFRVGEVFVEVVSAASRTLEAHHDTRILGKKFFVLRLLDMAMLGESWSVCDDGHSLGGARCVCIVCWSLWYAGPAIFTHTSRPCGLNDPWVLRLSMYRFFMAVVLV